MRRRERQPIAKSIQNTERQPQRSMSTPPTRGPNIGPTIELIHEHYIEIMSTCAHTCERARVIDSQWLATFLDRVYIGYRPIQEKLELRHTAMSLPFFHFFTQHQWPKQRISLLLVRSASPAKHWYPSQIPQQGTPQYRSRTKKSKQIVEYANDHWCYYKKWAMQWGAKEWVTETVHGW